MGMARFLLFTVVGTALWTARLTYPGYALGADFEQAGNYSDPISKAVIAIILVLYVWRVVQHHGAEA
ncbi:MAG: hypothetical protein M3Q40_03485 [Pseudomonadota bacterium]|nr:hypothetical protein [Pseudomonadota bacterium]